MNTKIILGIEMNSERQAVIESSPQDLSQDNRNIASLDKGEAIVTSTFTRFAVPVKIPLFEEFVKEGKKESVVKRDYVGFSWFLRNGFIPRSSAAIGIFYLCGCNLFAL